MSATKTTTPASTTVKVSTISGAAKDDLFAGISEDNAGLDLNVLANDPGSAKIWSLDQNALNAAAGSQQPQVLSTATLASGATISLNADGTVRYVGATTLQALGEGKTFTDSFQYTIRMANGALSTAKANVSITGVNDVATFSGDKTGGLTEEDTSTGGKLIVSDVDTGENSMQAGKSDGTLGSLTMATDGTWVYTLTSNMQSLAEGKTATDKVTVKSFDGTTQEIALTITGVNDAATFSGDKTGGLTEEDTSTGGKLIVSDVDTGENSMQAGKSDGTLGSLMMATDGTWVYTLTSNMQSLAEGKTATDKVTVKSFDGTTQDIELTITGVNDVATFGGTATGSVQEDGTTTASGTVSVLDVDNGEGSVLSTGALAGTYGNFTFDKATGAWTYTLNNDAINVQALTSSSSVQDKLALTSFDGGTNSEIVVTIGGADEPTPGGGGNGSGGNDTGNGNGGGNAADGAKWVLNSSVLVKGGEGFVKTVSSDGTVNIVATGFTSVNELQVTQLKYDANFIVTTDVDNDNVLDTVLTFHANGNDAGDVVLTLLGYSTFTPDQIF